MPDAAPPGADRTGQGQILRGILFMCLAVSLFPILNATVKYLSTDYATTQIIWLRYLGHLVFMLLVFMPKRGLRLLHTSRPGLQIFRSLLLFAATAFYFSALNYIPLANAATISFTSPFIITVLSVLMLGESVGPRRWIAVLIGFVGTVIIIRPGSDFGHWAALLVLGSATSYSFYQIFTRKLSGHDDASTTITFTAVVGVAVSSVVAPFDWITPQGWDWLLFLSLGFFGGFGHLCVVKSLDYAPASLLAPFGYVQLVGAVLLGYLVFAEFPDFWTWVGAAIIVASGSYIAYREGVRRRGG